MSTIFDNSDPDTSTQLDPNTVTLEDLVGEGKKYKDIADLVKAKVHGDNHINTLTDDTKSLRAELATRSTVEAALQKLTTTPNTPAPVTPEPLGEGSGTQPEVKALTIEDVESYINSRRETDAGDNNIAQVEREVLKHVGTPQAAEALIAEKAKAHGVSTEYLKNLAKESPALALKLLDVGTKPADTRGIPSRTLPTSGTPSQEEASIAALEGLRKTDPYKYNSPKVKADLLKLAMDAKRKELGL